jgi:signal transduction histidine kinase
MQPTAVARLTAWFCALFLLGVLPMLVSSYVLIDRSFTRFSNPSPATLAGLGLRQPSGKELDAFRSQFGVAPNELVAAAVGRAKAQALKELVWRSTVPLVLTVIVAAVGAWWLAHRLLRPVRKLTLLANEMSASRLHDRIDLVGPPDEMKALADTFDAMLNRLDRTFTEQRLFAAQVAHELRTPLASLVAEADLVDAAATTGAQSARLVAVTRATVTRVDRLIGSLLALSRAESGGAARTTFDVADVIGDIVSDAAHSATQAQVSLELRLVDSWMVGDSALIRAAVDNLLRNAIAYNQPGGSVTVDVQPFDDRIRICVENTGAPLTEEDVEALARPFVRGANAQSRAGSGIGSAVVSAVTSAHRGTLGFVARPGGGLVASIDLPRGMPPALVI